MQAVEKAVQAWLRDIRVKTTTEEVEALVEALVGRVAPKRITAKMLADLARRKHQCRHAGIKTGVCKCDLGNAPYAYVVLGFPPQFHTDRRWEYVYFFYADYGGARAAKQAAWNFLMERPDKEGE